MGMVEFSHYLFNAGPERKDTGHTVWGADLDEILRRINSVEGFLAQPISKWYGTDKSTGIVYGPPATASFPHMRITYSGAPARMYLRNRIDELRALHETTPFEWVYTPDHLNMVASDICGNGIDCRQIIEMLKAIGRITGHGDADQYKFLLRESESSGRSISVEYQGNYSSPVLSSRLHTSVNKTIRSNGNYNSPVSVVSKANLETESSVVERYNLGSYELGNEYGLPDDDAIIYGPGYASQRREVYSLKKNTPSDGLIIRTEKYTKEVMVYIIDRVGSSGYTSTDLDWVEQEGVDNLEYVTLSEGSPDPITLPVPTKQTVTHFENAEGTKESEYSILKYLDKQIISSANHGWYGPPYGSETWLATRFVLPFSPVSTYFRFHVEEESTDYPDLQRTIPLYNREENITCSLHTSHELPLTLDAIQGGDVVASVGDLKRYVWLVPDVSIESWLGSDVDLEYYGEADAYAGDTDAEYWEGLEEPDFVGETVYYYRFWPSENYSIDEYGNVPFDWAINPDASAVGDGMKSDWEADTVSQKGFGNTISLAPFGIDPRADGGLFYKTARIYLSYKGYASKSINPSVSFKQKEAGSAVWLRWKRPGQNPTGWYESLLNAV